MTKETVKKTVSLYDGSVNIEFNNLARNRYVVLEDGHSPVGVTTILQSLSKPALMTWPMYEAIDWLKKNPNDYDGASKAYLIKSDRGKSVGTDVHAWIENFLKEQVPYTPDLDAQKACNAFLRWFEEAGPEVLATEKIIYSKKFDYAGTFDALLKLGDETVLCDVKTTNASRSAPLGIYPEYLLQLGAYSLAYHEEYPNETIDDAMIIRVGKDGKLNTLRVSEVGIPLMLLEAAFVQLVSLYKFMTPLSKKLSEMEAK